MEYELLYYNDNNTAKVRMTIDGYVLEQDFDCTDLDANVKQGMAVFKVELDRKVKFTVADKNTIGKTIAVNELPTIPPEDFEPLPVPEPVVSEDSVSE